MEYREHLDSAISITFGMLKAAKNDSWEEVSQLEINRAEILNLIEQTTPEDSDSEAVARIEQLISLNNELMDLSSNEKMACFKRFSKNKNTQKAFSSYANI